MLLQDLTLRLGDPKTRLGAIQMNNKILLIILAILLAPLAVYLKKGAGQDLVINIILCFVFYIPAVVHALWIVTR